MGRLAYLSRRPTSSEIWCARCALTTENEVVRVWAEELQLPGERSGPESD